MALLKLPFDRGTTNFSGLIAQAKAANVEHVVFLGIPKDAALVLREMNNLGWKPQFSGHNALGDRQTFQLAGPLIEGAIAVAVMEPLDSDKPAGRRFSPPSRNTSRASRRRPTACMDFSPASCSPKF